MFLFWFSNVLEIKERTEPLLRIWKWDQSLLTGQVRENITVKKFNEQFSDEKNSGIMMSKGSGKIRIHGSYAN